MKGLQEASMLSRTSRICIAVVASAFGSAVATGAGAQQTLTAVSSSGHSVSGTIADADGNPVGGAEISLRVADSAKYAVRSDTNGRFRIDALPLGSAMLHVRRLGYRERDVRVNVLADRSASVFIKLEESAAPIDGMTVDGEGEELNTKLREFYARAQSDHFGYFIDEQRLEQLRPEQTSDALRAVPGVLVRPARIGNTVKIRGCSPLVWVDGLRAPNGELDDLTRGSDVAAIEIYTSQAGVPAQYTDRTATCGTILVWLKSD
jgi:hypothetical protein